MSNAKGKFHSKIKMWRMKMISREQKNHCAANCMSRRRKAAMGMGGIKERVKRRSGKKPLL